MAGGLLIALLGIWGALIPLVGPYFNYSFGTNSAWHYTSDRLWLDILPGVAALLAGLTLLLARTRKVAALGAWLAIAAGAWFAVGPAVSLTWEHGSGPIGQPLYGSTRQMLELLGYFYLLGAVIVALGAFVLGRLVPARAVEPAARTAFEGQRPGVDRQAGPATARVPAETSASDAEPASPTGPTRQPARKRVHVPFRQRERTPS